MKAANLRFLSRWRTGKLFPLAAHLDFTLDMLHGAQKVAQQLCNGVVRVGLEQIVEGVDRQRLPDIVAGGCDENERKARRELAQPLRRLDPVRSGHENIEKHGVIFRRRGALQQRVPALKKAETQLAAPSRRAAERPAQRLRVHRDVLHDRKVQQHGSYLFQTDFRADAPDRAALYYITPRGV